MLEPRIGIIGLGYVGLPLACLFAKHYRVVGIDIDETRINALRKGKDGTNEVSEKQLEEVLNLNAENVGLQVTTTMSDLAECNFYIITVPTPIDKFSRPNLKPLEKASAAVAALLKNGDYVVYESTVYPGVTEEVCVPILEEVSGLKLNIDFFVGYSPERINPGDKEKTVSKITKITSGSTVDAANYIDQIYATVIEAGTYKAASIKVAEAAKVIENAQRDVNIAFVNELAKIFSLLDIDTQEVLAAAGTKWNFLPFQPGLVGGHCIGVDPFYLAEKAKNHAVLAAISEHLQTCGLRLSQDKTKITYCQDYRRQKRKDYPKSFDFLGYTFKPMSKKSQRNSGVFLGFDCEMSRKARNRIVAGWRQLGFHRKSHTTLQTLAQQLNAQSRGLIRYFGVHSRWRLRGLFRYLDYRLAKWVKGKYKSITSYQKAYNYLRKIQNSYPNLFYHWSIIGLG